MKYGIVIFYIQRYAEDCQRVFGKFVHHTPFPIKELVPGVITSRCGSRDIDYDDCYECEEGGRYNIQTITTDNVVSKQHTLELAKSAECDGDCSFDCEQCGNCENGDERHDSKGTTLRLDEVVEKYFGIKAYNYVA